MPMWNKQKEDKIEREKAKGKERHKEKEKERGKQGIECSYRKKYGNPEIKDTKCKVPRHQTAQEVNEAN